MSGDTKSLTEGTQIKSSDERVLFGLTVLARNDGSVRRAYRECGIDDKTLARWRDQFPDKYAEIQEEIIPQIRARVSEKAVQVAERAHALELRVLAKIEEQLDNDEITGREAGNTLRNISTTKGISLTHANNYQAPVQKPVEETNTVEEFGALLSALTRAGVLKVPNEAPTIEAEVVEETP